MVEVLRVAILNFRESLSVIYNALVHDEIESSHVLSMRDMVSLQRLKLPCRSICCNHIPCFELEVYKSINKSKPLHTYKCPVCNNSCPPKTLYIDSVTLCLSELLPSEDKVLLLPDGTFSLGEKSRKRKADCIDLTGSDDEDQSGDADTVNYLAQLQQVLQKKWGSNRTTSFAELTPKQSSGIADVVQLMNSDQFTSAIRNNIFNFTVQTSLIARLPFHVVTDERLLIKQLTNIKGVGKVTAERIIKFYKEKLNEENNSVSAQPVSQIAIPWMDSAAPVPESQNSLVSLYVKRIHPIAASTMVPTSSTSGQNQAYSGVQDVRAIPNRSETSKTLPVASNLGATVYNTAFSTAKFTGQETLASVLGNNSTPSVGSSSLVNSLSASADSGQVAAVISVSATNTAAGGARATIPIDGSSAASNDTSPSKALRRLVPNNQLAGRANVVDLTLEDSPVLAERHAGNSSDTDLLDSDTDNANFRNRRMRIVDSESPRSSSGFFSGTVANNGSIDKFSSVPSSLSGLNIHNPVNNKDQNQRTGKRGDDCN